MNPPERSTTTTVLIAAAPNLLSVQRGRSSRALARVVGIDHGLSKIARVVFNELITSHSRTAMLKATRSQTRAAPKR